MIIKHQRKQTLFTAVLWAVFLMFAGLTLNLGGLLNNPVQSVEAAGGTINIPLSALSGGTLVVNNVQGNGANAVYGDYTLKAGKIYKFEVWGAKGGTAGGGAGGAGGYSVGWYDMRGKSDLTAYYHAGGAGVDGISGDAGTSGARPGGYNGGGVSGWSNSYSGGSGGGASDIRVGGITTADRVIVAGGGGGGGGAGAAGGAGGGSTGAAGGSVTGVAGGAGGGTASGGSGTGGTGGANTGGAGGGGGGGYNGGGGGGGYSGVYNGPGGGGGSGYIGGVDGLTDSAAATLLFGASGYATAPANGQGQVRVTEYELTNFLIYKDTTNFTVKRVVGTNLLDLTPAAVNVTVQNAIDAIKADCGGYANSITFDGKKTGFDLANIATAAYSGEILDIGNNEIAFDAWSGVTFYGSLKGSNGSGTLYFENGSSTDVKSYANVTNTTSGSIFYMQLGSGTISILGGELNSNDKLAIRNNVGAVTVSNAAITAGGDRAVYCYGTATVTNSTITTSGDRAIFSNGAVLTNSTVTATGVQAIYNNGSGTVAIVGGTVSASEYAVYNAAGSIVLSGTPSITGTLYAAVGKISVSAFVPQTNIYTLELSDATAANQVAVVGGAGFLNSFKVVNFGYGLQVGVAPNAAHLTLKAEYRIRTAEELAAFRDRVNGGNYDGRNVFLENDIDMTDYLAGDGNNSGAGWKPIGIYTGSIIPFTGVFDGQGYEITGLWMNRTESYVGLFGHTNNCTIKNIGIVLAEQGITGGSCTGGLAGSLYGNSTVDNCYVRGNVKSNNNAIGGIVGIVLASAGETVNISKSGFCGKVSSTNASGNIGGFVGYLRWQGVVNFSDCYAFGSVTAGNSMNAGGFFGSSEASLSNLVFTRCYAACAVNGGSATSRGALGGGLNGGTAVSTVNCFYDRNATALLAVANADFTGCNPKNTAEMKNQTTFSGAAWNFAATWEMGNLTGYPIIQGHPDYIVITEITSGDLSNGKLAVGTILGLTYKGSPHEPTTSVVYNGITLIAGQDFDYSYRDNTDAGRASLILIFKGSYSGEIEIPFIIDQTALVVSMIPVGNGTYGGTHPLFTFTGDNLQGTDTLSGLTYLVQNSNGDTVTLSAASPAGTYTIIPSWTNYNYRLTLNNGTYVIEKAVPTISAPAVTNGSHVYESALSVWTLNGGWTWVNNSLVPTVINSGYAAELVITPEDDHNYDYAAFALANSTNYTYDSETRILTYTGVEVTVTKAIPQVTTHFSAPSADAVTYVPGLTLADIDLPDTNAPLPGVWTWVNPETSLNATAETAYFARFTPSDTNNYQTVDVEVMVTVYRANGTANVSMQGWTYGNTAGSASITDKVGDSVFSTYEYSTSSDFGTTISAPSSASPVGTYYVRAVFTEGTNYNRFTTASVAFAITPATLTVTPDNNLKKIYGEADPELTYAVTGWQNGDEAEQSAILTGALSRETGESAASYRILLNGLTLNSENYTLSFVDNQIFVIEEREIKESDSAFDIGAIADQVYSGSELSPGITIGFTSAIVTKTLEEGVDFRLSYTANINAGQVTVTLIGMGNFKGNEATVTFTIKAAEHNALTWQTYPSDIIYGEDLTVAAATSIFGTVTYLYESTDGKGYCNTVMPLGAGEYKVTASVAGTANYNAVSEVKNFTIAKAQGTAGESGDFTVSEKNISEIYSGSSHTATVDVSVADGSGYRIYYSFDGLTDWTAEPLFYADAGNNPVYYKVVFDNYTDVSGVLSVDIIPVDISVTAVDYIAEYNGLAHTAFGISLVTVNSQAAAIGYNLDGSNVYGTLPEIKTAGIYALYFKVTAPNHTDYLGSITVKITAVSLNSGNWESFGITVDSIADQTYTGFAITPAVTVKENGTKLTLNTDYIVSYSGNMNAGTATVTIMFIKDFDGVIETTFRINPALATINASGKTITYTGNPQGINTPSTTPAGLSGLVVTYAGTGTTVYGPSLDAPSVAGTYEVTVTLTNANYAAEPVTVSLVIMAAEMGLNITVTVEPVVYTGNELMPLPSVYDGSKRLELGKDYEITGYSGNKNAGVNTATVTINGLGDYSGLLTTSFTILKADADITANNLTVTYKPATPREIAAESNPAGLNTSLTIKYLGINGTVYAESQSAPINAGEYEVTIVLINSNYKAEPVTVMLTVLASSLEKVGEEESDIRIVIASQIYSGFALSPKPQIVDGITLLTENEDYIIVGYGDNTNAGTASVTIIGMVNYTGTVEIPFAINKAAITVTATNYSSEYTGNTHTNANFGIAAATIGGQDFTMSYKLSEEDTYGLLPEITEAGIYTLYFKVTAENHTDYEGFITVRITKAEGVKDEDYILTESNVNETYTGGMFSARVETEVSDGSGYTIYYSEDEQTWVLEEMEYSEAGEYIVYYKIVFANYDNYTGMLTVTISKASGSANLELDGWPFGAAVVPEPQITSQTGDSVFIAFEYSTSAGSTADLAGKPSSAGSYYVRAVFAEGTNYLGFTTEWVPFVIAKRAGFEGESDDYNITETNVSEMYTGSAYAAAVAVTVSDGGYTVYYSADGLTGWTAELLPFINVCSEIVYYKVVFDNFENYEGMLTITITKAGQNAPDALTADAIGKYSIILAVIAGAEYQIEGGSWTDNNTFTNLDPNAEYTFYARLKGDGNHNPSSLVSASFTTSALAQFTVTVKYGNGLPDGEFIVTEEQYYLAVKPANPSRTGYIFNDWYNAEEGGEVFDWNTLATGNQTVWSQWTVNGSIEHSISYVSNGGSVVEEERIINGEKFTMPADPAKKGYLFSGWYTDGGAFQNAFDFDEEIIGEAQDIILYAKWVIDRDYWNALPDPEDVPGLTDQKIEDLEKEISELEEEVDNGLDIDEELLDKLDGLKEAIELEKAKREAIEELIQYVAELDSGDYTAENWAKIQEELEKGIDAINGAENVQEIADELQNAKDSIDAIPTIAEQTAGIEDKINNLPDPETVPSFTDGQLTDLEKEIADIEEEIADNGLDISGESRNKLDDLKEAIELEKAERKKIKGISVAGGEYVYNGENKTVSVSGFIAGDEITYSISGEEDSYASHPEIKNAGTYFIYVRIKRTGFATLYTCVEIKILQAAAGEVLSPTTSDTHTYGNELNNWELSDGGWAWANGSSTVPNVKNSGYYAVLDVSAYDSNYDYSGVEGYNQSTHTVRRLIAVTVTKAPASQIPDEIKNTPNPENQDYGSPLSDWELPGGWTWIDRNVIPDYDDNNYRAFIDVSDYDDNYDFSGIEGYDPDTHTIVREVPIGVNIADGKQNLFFILSLTLLLFILAELITLCVFMRRKNQRDGRVMQEYFDKHSDGRE